MGAELEGTRHLAHPALKLAVLIGAVVASTGGTTVTRVAVGSRPCAEIGAYGALWVANLGSSTLSRVDPAANQDPRTLKRTARIES